MICGESRNELNLLKWIKSNLSNIPVSGCHHQIGVSRTTFILPQCTQTPRRLIKWQNFLLNHFTEHKLYGLIVDIFCRIPFARNRFRAKISSSCRYVKWKKKKDLPFSFFTHLFIIFLLLFHDDNNDSDSFCFVKL